MTLGQLGVEEIVVHADLWADLPAPNDMIGYSSCIVGLWRIGIQQFDLQQATMCRVLPQCGMLFARVLAS